MTVRDVARIGVAVALLAVGCSTDPHKTAIDARSKESFTKDVEGRGLSAEEMELLKAAEARIQKSPGGDGVVGKTIGDVIASQRQWQKDHEQLTHDLEPLYRSAKAIQAATNVGVTYVKYGELVQAFATEATVANDKISTPDERRVAGLFQGALQAYRDAGALWQHQLNNDRFKEMVDGGVLYSLKGQVASAEVASIVVTYKIPIRDGKLKYLGSPYQVIPEHCCSGDATTAISSHAQKVHESYAASLRTVAKVSICEAT